MGTFEIGAKPDLSQGILLLEDCWNEFGLYVGLNARLESDYGYGLCTPHVCQLACEKCKTTEEALNLIAEIPVPDPKVYIVADKSGHFAVVEKTANGITKIIENKKSLISTNHYLHQDLMGLNEQIFAKIPFHSTFARYHYLESKLLNHFDEMNLEKAKNIMSVPPVLQNWRETSQGDIVTIWTLCINLKDGEYDLIFAPLNPDLSNNLNSK